MVHVFTSFVLFEGEKFHGGGRVWYFNVIWLKSIHTFTFIVTVFTASTSIRVSARNASLYIAVMIFCAQPYLKPCFMCPFYILSTCPSKGLCTALLGTATTGREFSFQLFDRVSHAHGVLRLERQGSVGSLSSRSCRAHQGWDLFPGITLEPGWTNRSHHPSE